MKCLGLPQRPGALPLCLMLLHAGPATIRAVELEIRAAATLQIPGDKVTALSFSPDGKTLAVGAQSASPTGVAQGKSLTLWDVESRDKTADLDVKGGAAAILLEYSRDGETLFGGGVFNSVMLWDTASLKRRGEWKGHERPVMSMALSPDGRTLATGSRDPSVKLWNVADGKLLATITDHTDAIEAVAFSPDGRTLASGSRDMTVRLWDAKTAVAKGTLSGHTGWVRGAAFSPDGKLFASAALDHTVRLCDLATGEFRSLTADGGIHCTNFSPDGRTIFTGTGAKVKPGVKGVSHGELTIWDVATAKSRFTLRDFPGQVSTLVFSPDGKLLAAGSTDGMVKLWNTTDLLGATQVEN